jgi:hypothetical protein
MCLELEELIRCMAKMTLSETSVSLAHPTDGNTQRDFEGDIEIYDYKDSETTIHVHTRNLGKLIISYPPRNDISDRRRSNR